MQVNKAFSPHTTSFNLLVGAQPCSSMDVCLSSDRQTSPSTFILGCHNLISSQYPSSGATVNMNSLNTLGSSKYTLHVAGRFSFISCTSFINNLSLTDILLTTDSFVVNPFAAKLTSNFGTGNMKLLGKSWKYINEGNIHIVVQILDTNHVLRLIKEDERTDPESVYDHVNFVNLIMVPLLRNKFYGKEEAIEISQYDLEQLSKMLLPHRPQNRVFKSVLSQIAIKATNLSIVSSQCETNFCVEIKPKEGFISNSLRKYSTCYYCLKQHLKLWMGAITQTSKYCPLDLFSGQRERMKLSLLNMIKNAQNNFKIFKNGLLVYNEKSEQGDFDYILKDMNYFSDLDQFLDFIIDILLSDINQPYIKLEKSKKHSLHDKPNQCYEGQHLKSNSFLYNLLQLQKMTDSNQFDMENEGNKHSNYVKKLIEQLSTLDLDLNIEKDRETFLKTTNPIHLALISAVAKDCSIMIIQRIIRKGATIIQPHSETRAKQLEAWQQLITEYLKTTKQSTIDIRESQNSPLFNNTEINRKLSQEAILTILEDMAKTGRAAPVDKSKNIWEVYWHSLDEWGNLIYNWACNNGMNNSVCTLFELREGENTADQEFHGLDMNVLVKALKNLEVKGRCELIEFDDNQGVKTQNLLNDIYLNVADKAGMVARNVNSMTPNDMQTNTQRSGQSVEQMLLMASSTGERAGQLPRGSAWYNQRGKLNSTRCHQLRTRASTER
ncbi:hypothetical protein HW555_003449 [Spodoptera exigua]|uniref:Vacuolar protein-sorting-associated protein 25 n=1 Tax=Spodoptera exigua TaxID=7107 RepID=A0A835L672_SPOEX|nr:hypothetical protein HW555_003449 [Spodoptera exigua]